MKDFFVSYTGADVDRATWVAEVLEANNYSVTIQAWDFRAGDNFVSKINEALKECEKQILILSENYLKSKWCEAEWTSKLAEQMRLHDRRIIPVKIEQVTLEGLLTAAISSSKRFAHRWGTTSTMPKCLSLSCMTVRRWRCWTAPVRTKRPLCSSASVN